MNRVMGMNADSGNHMGVTGGNIDGFPGGIGVHPGNGHGPDPGGAGPVEHGIHVFIKTGVIDMTVRVEQDHHGNPYGFKCQSLHCLEEAGFTGPVKAWVCQKNCFSALLDTAAIYQ
jgi:hypothetical protein